MISSAWILGPTPKGQRALLPESPGAGIREVGNPDLSVVQGFVDDLWLCIAFAECIKLTSRKSIPYLPGMLPQIQPHGLVGESPA